MAAGGLREVDSVEVVCLVDNVVDSLLGGTDVVKRPFTRGGQPPVEAAPFMGPGKVTKSMRAEHGFSALISFRVDSERHSILLDSGISLDGLAHNATLLGIDIQGIEAVVLSHGHPDHVAGLGWLAGQLGGRGVPLIAHPDAWRERRFAPPERPPRPLPPASRPALEAAGLRVQDSIDPTYLFDGALLITGEIERTTDFEMGFPFHETRRDGEWQPDPLILDDQAVVLNMHGKGLVVVTGCGHAGMINTLRYAMKVSGVERVHAVIGGFHLSGPLFEGLAVPTVEAMRQIAPSTVVPCHCTGWTAGQALAAALPEAFVQNSVGTAYLF